MAGEPKAIRAGDGQVFRILGNAFTFKVVSADTQDAYAVFEIASPPNGGIPPHVNTRESETHIVLHGRYRFVLGGESHEAGPGTVFLVPRGTPHAFQNVGADPGRMLLVPSPACNNETFVLKLAERFGGELPASGPDPGMLKALGALAHEYGVEPAIS